MTNTRTFQRFGSWKQWLIALWGVGGVALILGDAIWRLTPLAIVPIEEGMLTPFHWSLYIGWAAFNAYAEGYRGFQRSFSPMVIERVFYLAKHPKPLHVILAPFFCMGLFHAHKRRLIVSWCVLGAVAVLILIVRSLLQPWRGIVDVGVVVGLSWGTLSMLYFFVRAALGHKIPYRNSMPEGTDMTTVLEATSADGAAVSK